MRSRRWRNSTGSRGGEKGRGEKKPGKEIAGKMAAKDGKDDVGESDG